MLLEPLVSTVETIKARIAIHGSTLRQNETRTRAALIDPLLTALGWDATDPALVTPEYRVDVGWADYALAGVGNQPVAVIEAKRLGSVVENHLEQAVGYCIQQGIAYAGVTDGNHWQLYRTFEPVPLADKIVLDVSIADTPSHETALKLLLLWRPNLASGQPVAADAPIVSSPPEPAPAKASHPANILPRSTPTPSSESAQSASISVNSGWESITGVSYQKGGEKPTGIRFPDSKSIEIGRGWTDMWFQVCEWLASTGRLTENDCPIRVSSRASRYLVNRVQTHSNNKPFGQPKTTTTGLFVERQFEPKKTLEYALFLLDKFGVPGDTVELRFD